MKKIIALLLAMLLVLAVPAFAEEGTWIRQLPQYVYSNDTLLTWESYPEVRIAPFSAYKYFTNYSPEVPVFVCFPAPADALANDFDVDYVHYLDVNNAIQYSYQVLSSDSWEEFVNKAAEDSYILMDGSDGMAAYIDPEGLRAYGMIATKEFGRTSKMIITVKLDYMSTKMPQDKIIAALTDAITTEVNRVSAEMRYETFDTYWNQPGDFVGMKFLDDYDFSLMLKLAFPTLTLTYSDGSTKDAEMIVTRLRYGTLYGVYNFGDGLYIEAEIKLDDNPYPIYRMGEGDVDAQEQTLANGKTWYCFMSGLTENGKSSYVYASVPLGVMNHWDKEYYLTIHLDGENIAWGGYEDLLEDVAKFDVSYELMNPDDDPYVEPERPETTVTTTDTQAPAETADGTWTCPECGSENTGKFCPECGAAKPESAEWTCPNCGSVSEGKFCPECGTAKP